MKTLKILCLLSIITLSYTACKKDKTPKKTDQEKIVGKWNYVSKTTIISRPASTTTRQGLPGEYFEFTADGKLTISQGNNIKSGPYSINGNNKLEIDGAAFDIDELTENRLVFSLTERDGNDTLKVIYTLNKS